MQSIRSLRSRRTSAESKIGDLDFCQRRTEPHGHLGLQTGASKTKRPIARRLRQQNRLLPRSGRAPHGLALCVVAAKAERHVDERTLSAPGQADGQDGVHSLVLDGFEQSFSGAVHDEYRGDAHGLPVRGLLGDLRPWHGQRFAPEFCGDERPAEPRIAQRKRVQLGFGLFAERLSRHLAAADWRADR
jgi:hypothetical protein